MVVRNVMTSNPFTVSPDTTIAEALAIMREKGIRRLPVMKGGKLIGIVTKRRLLEVSPSPATTLSVFEMNYLLAKTVVRDIMTKEVLTVSPDALLEQAAVLMADNNIGGLPVLDGGRLVGIITEKDIFQSFVEILGFRDAGSRISIDYGDNRPGVLASLSSLMADMGINISHVAIYKNEIIFRVNTNNVDALVASLKDKGFTVTSVYRGE
jgi:acetoin utilization protein AcuB